MNTTQQPETRRFTKKPVVIEAFQMTKERRASNADWPEWMHRAWQLDREAPGSLYPTEEGTHTGTLSIGTLEGPHLVSWGDWIIQGVKGELYPCKPDIFEMTYAPETKLHQQGKCLYQIDEPQAKALHLSHTLSGGKLIDDSTEWADTLQLSFGDALKALKAGQRVARTGWNGKGMWLAYTPGTKFAPVHAKPGHASAFRAKEAPHEDVRLMPHIDMRAADGSMVIGWLASQTDMLAEDWEVLV